MEIKVRMEQQNDYDAVVSVTELAFKNMAYADGNEHELVRSLRTSENFIPELSLVAEHDGRVIGHIMFTTAKIIGNGVVHSSLTLAPESVHPDFQNLGIGSKLIREGLRIAGEMGFSNVNVLGHPDYYPRFGFKNAGEFGIKLPFDVPDGAFMCMELVKGSLKGVSGIMQFAKEFGIT